MFGMPGYIAPVLFITAAIAIQALGLFVVVYFATRLAIRHERRISS